MMKVETYIPMNKKINGLSGSRQQFYQERNYIYPSKKFRKYEIGQTNDNLSRRHFPLLYRPVIWIIIAYVQM
jgi:hypothetical protein